MRNIKSTKVFISAARTNQTPEELAADHADLRRALESTVHVEHVREVQGCFAGLAEPAFCVWLRPGSILEGIDTLTGFGSVWGQHSVLVVHGDDAAELVECDTDCSAILGTFVALPEGETPKWGEDYTLAGGVFYVVR